ncbi:hypothetical protein K493DRAFT_315611 [Basidiobolus meristosporus CBS 931.73]|uniref:Uncharacterized protein n=1 Tax=Basidiobolus meristosporus CBS 931.73 TaxID=1314790 RepID=A0A1Y1Y9F3_9FUNG|nr:hypothetical protein K493DRAFT_315611 [Basidiobolus meristosporus CBS 931.73]|eukprot:ORX94194.1 hypothetical protein K493DRAFT_315611 [Basidiobolus meristosporus CBS 931.73]
MDTNWCTVCDKHVAFDDDLYCSAMCRLQDSATLDMVPAGLTYQRKRSNAFSTTGVRSPSFKAYLPSPPLSPVTYISRGRSNKISPPNFHLGGSDYKSSFI